MSMTKISKYIYPDNLEKSNFSYVDKPEIKKKWGKQRRKGDKNKNKQTKTNGKRKIDQAKHEGNKKRQYIKR